MQRRIGSKFAVKGSKQILLLKTMKSEHEFSETSWNCDICELYNHKSIECELHEDKIGQCGGNDSSLGIYFKILKTKNL